MLRLRAEMMYDGNQTSFEQVRLLLQVPLLQRHESFPLRKLCLDSRLRTLDGFKEVGVIVDDDLQFW